MGWLLSWNLDLNWSLGQLFNGYSVISFITVSYFVYGQESLGTQFLCQNFSTILKWSTMSL